MSVSMVALYALAALAANELSESVDGTVPSEFWGVTQGDRAKAALPEASDFAGTFTSAESLPVMEFAEPSHSINRGDAVVHRESFHLSAEYGIAAPEQVLLVATGPTLPYDAAPTAPLLSDIEGHWAEDAIRALAAKGIVEGFYEDGDFHPDAPMTRAEYAALIRKALPQNAVQSSRQFVDVPTYHWAYSAIQSAVQMGFFKGRPSGEFDPNQNVSRMEVFNALNSGLKIGNNSRTARILAASFQNVRGTSQPAGNFIVDAPGVWISGEPQAAIARPNSAATRAEVAAAIYETLSTLRTVGGLEFADF